MERTSRRTIDNLTDPDAVTRAIAEYDDRGRDAFNAHYGFGGARRYVLVHEGKRYDAKSILMAAYGYQFPDHGPLTNVQLESKRRDVHDPLLRLGFTVVEDTDVLPRTSITGLTDPAAVVAAMTEFDQLGRSEFLARYEFAPAEGYFIAYNGRRYDSKAIAGRAFGIQHPHVSSLQARQFSGGAATVQRTLERLGFTVVRPDTEISQRLSATERADVAAEPDAPPMVAVENALAHLVHLTSREPALTEAVAMEATTIVRKARSAAFRVAVRRAYDFRCAVCGLRILGPRGEPEVEGAHIYPRSYNGSDDPRNGIALCRHHHWCFDRGMFAIADDYTTIVREGLPDTSDYDGLRALAGRSLTLPIDFRFRPHAIFLKARRELM